MKQEMTGKERIKAAMELKQPDRVPLYPVLTYMHASRIIRHKIIEIMLEPSLIYDSLLSARKEYSLDGFSLPMGPSRGWDDNLKIIERDGNKHWAYKDSDKLYARLQEDDIPILTENGPLVSDESDIEKIEVIKAEDYIKRGQLDAIYRVIKAVGREAFISGQCGNQTMNSLVMYRGIEDGLVDLIENKDLVHAIMHRATDITIEAGKAFIEAGVDCIYIGDAWSNSNIISPAHFEEFCVPQYKRAVDIFHRYGVKVYLHICGNSTPILEKMASTGVDAIEPLDPLGGVRLEDAKARVGHTVCLKGGINTMTLINGDVSQVEQEVILCLEAAKGTGGYIFGTGDDIPRDAPVENVRMMAETVRKYGVY